MGLRDKVNIPPSQPSEAASPAKKPAAKKAAAKKAAAKKPATKKKTAAKKKVSKAKGISDGLVTVLKKKVDAEESVSTLASDDILSEVTEFIPTGFPGIDEILGGGWAVGRASEVYGPEGSGKSALAHMAIKGVQSIGGECLYLDFENALDPQIMDQLGIDSDRLVYARVKHIQKAWDLIFETVEYLKKNKPDAPFLIIWDSIGGSPAKEEVDADKSENHQVGVVARAMAKGCKKMFFEIAKVRAHMMWINQERDKIGGFAGFGDNKQTTGGAAVRYAASQRCRVVKVSTLKVSTTAGAPASGYLVKTSTKKNRCAPPHQDAVWTLDFKLGPSPEKTMLQVLMDANKIKSDGQKSIPSVSPSGRKSVKKATAYKANGLDYRFTKGEWVSFLANVPEAREALTAMYLDIVRQGGAKAALEAQERGWGDDDDAAEFHDEDSED